MRKISVVVPIYNGEKTIARCLDSLLAQELDGKAELEIVVVDDGSSDGSAELLRAYAKDNTCIRIISQENRGLGAARNRGVRETTGEYIGFVDCDDFIAPEMYRTMLEAIERTGAALAVCQEKNVYNEDGNLHLINETRFPITESKAFSGTEILSWQINYTYMILNCAWNKLYERHILEDFDLCFPEDHRYAEDMVLSAGVYSHIDKVALVPQSLYYYVHTKGSISYSYSLRHAEDVYLDWEEIIGYIKKRGIKINTDNFSLGMYFSSLKQLSWVVDPSEKKSLRAKQLREKWEKTRREQNWKPDFSSVQTPLLHRLKIYTAYYRLCGPMFGILKLLRWIPFFKYMV